MLSAAAVERQHACSTFRRYFVITSCCSHLTTRPVPGVRPAAPDTCTRIYQHVYFYVLVSNPTPEEFVRVLGARAGRWFAYCLSSTKLISVHVAVWARYRGTGYWSRAWSCLISPDPRYAPRLPPRPAGSAGRCAMRHACGLLSCCRGISPPAWRPLLVPRTQHRPRPAAPLGRCWQFWRPRTAVRVC